MRLKPLLVLFFLISIRLAATADDTTIVRKQLAALRVAHAPRIDGMLDDSAWANAQLATDFVQNSPVEGAAVTFKTEVKVLYDNQGIYIGAMMYDNAPDSIVRLLGLRDEGLNDDKFRMVFDTYNTQQDAFDFVVCASGVQQDSRFSDFNFNAVWASDVKILPNGWSAEIAIPWSALRFPTLEEQTWGLQFTRWNPRLHEFDQWALTPKGKPNSLKYWGELTGLENIEAPIRLSLTPYLSTIWQEDNRFGEANPSLSVGGGMGLKYGINESFTLDMTLLPDFSQVKSDDVVKNLSPFEIQFDEQRPFFTEGVDLFQLGDIFYSRRIGKTPTYFYDAPSLADSSEHVTKNPSQSRLLNATKITGRTNEGLGIGILNAFVDNTYALARDTITGETRKILTESRSNYNVIVFDKQLANSSDVFVINTNVIRTGNYRSSNVTAAGFSLNNKNSTWNVSGRGAISDVLNPIDTLPGEFNASIGYKYTVGISKNSGKFQYGIRREVVNRHFDPDDLGIIFETNYSRNNAYVNYFIFNPWKIFNSANFEISASYKDNLQTRELSGLFFGTFSFFEFRNFWNAYIGNEWAPVDSRDYYEPRTEGRYYIRTRYNSFWGGVNSDGSKRLSYGINFHGGQTARVTATIPPNPWGGGSVYLFWRIGNHFTVSPSSGFHGDWGDRGWVNTEDDGTIVFGRRIIHNWENVLTANFAFNKDMSVSFIGRHFWSTGQYLGYYILLEDGTLRDYPTYDGQHDFSFNSFNIDVVYTWIFAPGSVLSVGWKKNILGEDTVIDFDYMHNLNTTLHGPQLNQVSARVLYYLDYNSVRTSAQQRKAAH